MKDEKTEEVKEGRAFSFQWVEVRLPIGDNVSYDQNHWPEDPIDPINM